MTDRLCILDDVRLELRPVNLRLWIGVIVLFIAATVFGVSAGAWYIVRQDYVTYSSMMSDALAQRDGMMRICVLQEDATKKMAAKRKTALGVGGEGR